jgi:hypothetical protein
MKWYLATLQRDFARHGFTSCPLTNEQITSLYKDNIKLEQAYDIGCDVANGFDFEHSRALTMALSLED